MFWSRRWLTLPASCLGLVWVGRACFLVDYDGSNIDTASRGSQATWWDFSNPKLHPASLNSSTVSFGSGWDTATPLVQEM